MDVADFRNLSDDTVDPEKQLMMKAKRGLFYRALTRLSELSREMILLKEIQGLSLEEVSEMLNVPLGTAKSRSHRARLELAESYLAVSRSTQTGAGT
jgi:RNA polymerase sigma-70 factor (ECF subfamily)